MGKHQKFYKMQLKFPLSLNNLFQYPQIIRQNYMVTDISFIYLRSVYNHHCRIVLQICAHVFLRISW